MALPRQTRVRVRPGGEADFDAIRGCYGRLAVDVNGFLDRGPAGWSAHRQLWRQRSVFVAEAGATESLPTWARAGMEGVGKIDVGEQRVWRVALKKVVDYFYQVFWL